MNTDKAWQIWAQHEPYYAVITDERFLAKAHTEESMEAFFRGGRDHVERLQERLEKHFGTRVRPLRALDFGCGVGRVLVPLAGVAEEVIGVDVAPAMLTEAKRNLDTRAKNTAYHLMTTDEWRKSNISYDFLHCHIVLQHIRPKVGLALLDDMLSGLQLGGFCVLQFHYHADVSPGRRLLSRVKNRVPFLNQLTQVMLGKRHVVAPMEMNVYPMNDVLEKLLLHGVTDNYMELSDHLGMHRVTVYGRRNDA